MDEKVHLNEKVHMEFENYFAGDVDDVVVDF